MQRHGSESYFIIGEGLLAESLDGRPATMSLAVEEAVPPFRFSRMGPKGTGKQLGEPNRRKIAEAMTVANLTPGAIPAGFTYLGQFIDHDLTFDKTILMEDVDIPPATIESSRSPTLDLDSLYGAGPQDPGSAQFYSDGLHLKMGAADGSPGRTGLRPAAGDARAGRDDPGRAERREPGGRADPPRDDPLPQPGGRHAPRLGSCGTALPDGAEDRHEALPVDAPHGLPAADLLALRSSPTSSARAARRSRSERCPRPCPRCRSSSPSPPSAWGTA